ncbi:hypothetical protein LINPERPRIM_LOCUS27852 [Linum perenne]
MGHLAAINHFIPRASERYTPFFRTLKIAAKFAWTEECTKAFKSLKEFLASPPVLVVPKPAKTLFLYRVVAPSAISMVLVH